MKKKVVLYSDDIVRLGEIKSFIDENFDQEISIIGLSKKFTFSKTTLRRHFLACYNETIPHYVRRCRMVQAMALLTTRSIPISQIGMTVGYRHRSAFTHAFTKFFGNPPAHFLRAGEDNANVDQTNT